MVSHKVVYMLRCFRCKTFVHLDPLNKKCPIDNYDDNQARIDQFLLYLDYLQKIFGTQDTQLELYFHAYLLVSLDQPNGKQVQL